MNNEQQIIFDIYLEVKRIFEKYNLRYWAIGGTCLGAVRHQGFIPWDSDMDIALPDVDFRRFLEVAPKELENTKYEVRSRLLGDMVTRVFDSSTTEIMPANLCHPERYVGVHVDIMPFFGMPEGQSARKRYAFFMGLLHYIDSMRLRRIGDSKRLLGKIGQCLVSPLILFSKENTFYDMWLKVTAKYKYDESEYTCFLWADFRYALRLILKTEWFNEWIELPFESSTIRCPKDSDSYLKTQYGDYMTPPSQEEINNYINDGWFVDLDRSYEYYQKHGLPDDMTDYLRK